VFLFGNPFAGFLLRTILVAVILDEDERGVAGETSTAEISAQWVGLFGRGPQA